MSPSKRSLRTEKLARIYDDEILPVWAERFGRLILRDLTVVDRGQVLDVSCATGYLSAEILRRMGQGARLIAIDPSSAMVDAARRKIEELGVKGVFFRTEDAEPRLSFADDVYDLVVCNLGLWDMENPAGAVADFARVTVPGGEVRCSLPLAGTFEEFFDIYREVLTKHDKSETVHRLNDYITRKYPTVEQCERWMKAAGVRGTVEVDRFSMLFRSSREFFFAPVIEFGPLRDWKRVAGHGQEMQDVFWYIKEAIDAYFSGRAFEVTVYAGCLTGEVLEEEDAATGKLDDLDDFIELRTGDFDLESVNAIIAEQRGEADVSALDDVAIEAFVEGAERPPHLDDPDKDNE